MSNTPELLRQVVSATGEKLWVANYIWDPNILDWIAMTPASAPGGGGPVTIADGQDTAEGARADVAWDGAALSATGISIWKRMANLLAGGLPASLDASGGLKVAVVASTGGGGPATIADGADVTQGAKADAAWDGIVPAPTAQGILKYLGAKIEAVRALLAGTLTVGGSVGVNNFPASQAVTGPLTDTQLRASAVPVSGPLTDTQLRASAVPVSGTVSANLGTIAGVATETTLGGVKTGTDKIPADPAREGGNLATLTAKDFATQATLGAAKADLDTLVANSPALGQALASASIPVALASDLQTIDSRRRRQMQEEQELVQLATMLADLAVRERGRTSFADPRGRYTRGVR